MQTEVCALCEEIRLTYEAAVRGLTGVSQVANHQFISAKMGRLEELHNELATHVGDREATNIVNQVGNEVIPDSSRLLYQEGTTK